jgi:putative NADH-flavin reductase
MNILIFGATGGSGKELTKLALEQGHNVTALVRNPATLGITHTNLTVVQGDVLNADSVSAVVKGKDAIFSALGTKVLKPNTIVSDGTKNILAAMQTHGVKRFICETSLGLGDSKEQLNFFFEYIVIPFFLKNVFADKEVQEQLIMQSNTDWTIVRPAGLTDGVKTSRYRSGFDKTITGQISRADVADFMLKQLTDTTYLRKAPSLAY